MASPHIPGFTDVEEAGRSLVAVTYRARDEATGRAVVLHVLDADGAAEQNLERFAREQDVLMALADHPHLAAVLGHGITPDGRPYAVTAAVQGEPLEFRHR